MDNLFLRKFKLFGILGCEDTKTLGVSPCTHALTQWATCHGEFYWNVFLFKLNSLRKSLRQKQTLVLRLKNVSNFKNGWDLLKEIMWVILKWRYFHPIRWIRRIEQNHPCMDRIQFRPNASPENILVQWAEWLTAKAVNTPSVKRKIYIESMVTLGNGSGTDFGVSQCIPMGPCHLTRRLTLHLTLGVVIA